MTITDNPRKFSCLSKRKEHWNKSFKSAHLLFNTCMNKMQDKLYMHIWRHTTHQVKSCKIYTIANCPSLQNVHPGRTHVPRSTVCGLQMVLLGSNAFICLFIIICLVCKRDDAFLQSSEEFLMRNAASVWANLTWVPFWTICRDIPYGSLFHSVAAYINICIYIYIYIHTILFRRFLSWLPLVTD